MVLVTGTDAISLGAGKDTIDVTPLGHALVLGATSVAGSGYSLTFVGGTGTTASTVLGGAGSYNIHAGAGGGLFTGGSAGNNMIVGSTGAVTITGGGAGDTLRGGTASDLIKAAHGNETLFGGAGNNTFDLQVHTVANQGGTTTTDVINDFNLNDKLNVGGTLAINYAINTYQMTAAGGYFYLEDGTKVVLQGFHTKINATDFKH